MKKQLLLAAITLLVAVNLSAQCTPDPQYTSSGIYPDSATNFLPACIGEPYFQLITNVVPADTTVTLPPLPEMTVGIDSIVVLGVTGLPPGLSFACNNGDCAYLGGTTGCATITGTPTTAGTYTVIFQLKAHSLVSQAYTVDYYKIVVTACAPVGVNELSSSTFKMFPNPTNDKTVIQGFNGKKANIITLTDASGKTIQAYQVDGDELEINTAGLDAGLYFVNIFDENRIETLKLIKE